MIKDLFSWQIWKGKYKVTHYWLILFIVVFMHTAGSSCGRWLARTQVYSDLGYTRALTLTLTHKDVCQSVRLFVCPSVSQSVCLSVRLSVCPSVRLSVCPLSVCVGLSVCRFVRLSVCLSVCPSVRLSVCLSSSFWPQFWEYHNHIWQKYAHTIEKETY